MDRLSITDADTGDSILELARRLYPICRSITGDGVRETLRLIGQTIPLEIFEVSSGTRVFDWQVPKEWNVRDAYVRDSEGRKVIDFRDSNLHLVSYSIPVDERMSLSALRSHLHSLPDHPDWIPYRTSYYNEDWGFCLADRSLQSLADGTYDVRIDTTLAAGSLTYAECFVAGQLQDEVLVYTHTCHPSLANDNCSGMAVTAKLAEAVAASRPRFSYRFVFGPGTIGSITWLAKNEQRLAKIAHGLVIGLVGDGGAVRYKRSRRDTAPVDDAASYVLQHLERSIIDPFTPWGYDERQFCSPGIDLPMGRLTRSGESGYPEYHSSADDLSVLDAAALADSLRVCFAILQVLDDNAYFLNLYGKGEPQLGKRGLYRNKGGAHLPEREFALLWMLNQSSGDRSILDIARTSGLPFDALRSAAGELEAAGLLRRIEAAIAAPEHGA